MISTKYNMFRKAVKKRLVSFRKGTRITGEQLDTLSESLMADRSFDSEDRVYCRDSFVYLNKIAKNLVQIVAFQINSFGRGIFSDSITRFCTPILLTVRAHGKHYFLRHDVRESHLSIDEFYLGKHYCGSKGPLCARDRFNTGAQKLFIDPGSAGIVPQQIVYRLMNANYLCHHIAETTGYAFGALHNYWLHKHELCSMSSGSSYHEKQNTLRVDIISDFSGSRISSTFKVPHYHRITGDVVGFTEEYDVLEWETTINGEKEKFLLPSGYQKAQLKKCSKDTNVITSQHMIEFVLEHYFKLINVFVIASTYQTLEYISRAMIAKREQNLEAYSAYMKTATFCAGYCPERDIDSVIAKKAGQFNEFNQEYYYSMFFRPPVLK